MVLASNVLLDSQHVCGRLRVLQRGALLGRCNVTALCALQAVAYLVRPNAPTLAAIRTMRLDTAMHQVACAGARQPNETVPFPLPPGTISIHVRCAGPACALV